MTPTDSLAVAEVPAASDRFPRVSVLMTTLPATRMRQRDVARLDALLRRFENTLARNAHPQIEAPELVRRVRRVAEVAIQRPARRGVALFVDENNARAATLPQGVFDRIVVDDHFDERDVLLAAQYNTPFRLLVVSGGLARLYESRADEMLVERRDRFPLAGPPMVDTATFAQLLAEDLAAVDAEEQRPLVYAGDDRTLVDIIARHAQEFAGRLDNGRPDVSADVLHRRARSYLRTWRSEQARALIPERDDPAWVHGSGAVQDAVRRAPSGTMIVEETFNDTMPRSIHMPWSSDGHSRAVGVNAAIARLRTAGGHVVFVPDGELRPFDGVTYRP